MTIASLEDYELRFGTPSSPETIAVLLEDASALVQQITRQYLEYVADDTVTLDVKCYPAYDVFLPELPVTAVTSVKDNVTAVGGGITVAPTTGYYLFRGGRLVRVGGTWTYGPGQVEVTYSHGYETMPGWLINIVCAMAHRGTQSWATEGVKSESFVDAYSVTYAAGNGSLIGATPDEENRLVGLRVPQLA